MYKKKIDINKEKINNNINPSFPGPVYVRIRTISSAQMR